YRVHRRPCFLFWLSLACRASCFKSSSSSRSCFSTPAGIRTVQSEAIFAQHFFQAVQLSAGRLKLPQGHDHIRIVLSHPVRIGKHRPLFNGQVGFAGWDPAGSPDLALVGSPSSYFHFAHERLTVLLYLKHTRKAFV